jgi:hypothetical protein
MPQHILCALLLAVASFLCNAQTVERITFNPASPRAGERLIVDLEGSWPNGCVPYRNEVIRDGLRVSLRVVSPAEDSPETILCTAAIRPWSMRVDLGYFTAGTLQLTVRAGATSSTAAPLDVTATPLPTTGLLSDFWVSPDEPGWGVALNEQADVVFATWFIYQSSGQPTWLVMPAGSRVGERVTGDLFGARGSAADLPWVPAAHGTLPAGRAQFDFLGNDRATLAYSINGRPVVRSLTRFTTRAQSLAQTTFVGTYLGEITTCTVERGTFALARYFDLSLTVNGPRTLLRLVDRPQIGDAQAVVCTFTADAKSSGSSLQASGTFSCTNNGGEGTFRIDDLRLMPPYLNFDLAYRRGACEIAGRAAAVRVD